MCVCGGGGGGGLLRNSENFSIINFSLIAFKDIFAILKFRDWSMLYLYQKTME